MAISTVPIAADNLEKELAFNLVVVVFVSLFVFYHVSIFICKHKTIGIR